MLPYFRNQMMSKDSRLSARDYVQDDITLLWDGIENADWGVHNAAATTWKNLAGGGWDLDITASGTWKSNAIHGDGTGAMAIHSSAEAADYNALALSLATVEIVCSYDSLHATNADSIFLVGSTNANGRFVMFDSSLGYLLAISKRTDYYSAGLGIPLSDIPSSGVPMQMSADFLTTNMRYAPTRFTLNDGQAQGTSARNSRATVLGIYVGGRGNVFNLIGDIYCIRGYSVAKTEEELAHNYAIDVARFNLPAAT